MRKFLGKLGVAVVGSLLHAATLLLLISSAFCHAQDYCNTPITVTSVSPSTWMAGKTYNITITGTGFDPILDRDTNWVCMATASLTTDEGNVELNDVTYVNSTTLTATIKFAADTPTQAATLQVENFLFDTGGGPIATAQVQILGTPKIKWNDKRISVIGDADPTPQNAVVGQQIKLITKPTVEELTALGLSFLTNTWTAGPASGPSNNVGGYTMTATATDASTKITQTKLDKPDLTTYWLYPQSDNPLTYKYCVNIPGLSADDIANGLNCSLVAKATFNVSGPTATIVPTPKAWHVSRPIPVCTSTGKEQMLSFGKYNPTTSTTCNPVVETSGMTFTATVNIVPGSSGQTEWVQVLGPTNTTTGTGGGQPIPSTNYVGLDSTLPYNFQYPDPVDATTTETNDSPGTPLDITWDIATRTFNAKMYLMWTSQIPDSITVSLGYVQWAISGTATANDLNKPPWSLTSSGPTSKHFHRGVDDGTKTHGLPKFSHLVVKNTNAVADENETEANEEEQQ
ncbi:MAG: hypothetical protein WCA89_18670 [Terracidiphilus sp.]|jgi:hypothetical protein